MIAAAKPCPHDNRKKHGRDRKGNQRFRCKLCGKTWTERHCKVLGDMHIPPDLEEFCLRLLLEGNSIRSVDQLTGTRRDAIMKRVVLVGERCQSFVPRTLPNS